MKITVRTAANYLLNKANIKKHTLQTNDLKRLLIYAEGRFKERKGFDTVAPYKDREKIFDCGFLASRIVTFKGKGNIKSKKHRILIECLDVVYEAYYSTRLKQTI